MAQYKIFDASRPPESAPPGAQGVLGYVGREGFTPHVWTLAEWQRFAHLVQFPAWVPDLKANPFAEGAAAAAAVKRLGWAPHQPHRRAIIGDLETSADPEWWQKFSDQVGIEGFVAVDYGSLSTVLGNAAYDVWAADWDGIPAIVPGQTIQGDQYKANVPWQGTQIDLSVVDQWLMDAGGVGGRHL